MRIAVLHHRCRGDVDTDTEALVDAARESCAEGAEIIICPRVPSLAGLSGDARRALLADIEGCIEGAALLISFADDDASEGRIVETPLGRTALVAGDAVLKPETAARLRDEGVHAAVWRPGAESELQAEAIMEYALGCAPVLAGLLVLSECSGTLGHPAHSGMSAIMHLGALVAQSEGESDETLMADLEMPLAAPEPGMPLPEVPTLLQQRVATHEGRKVPVEYPADLS